MLAGDQARELERNAHSLWEDAEDQDDPADRRMMRLEGTVCFAAARIASELRRVSDGIEALPWTAPQARSGERE